MARNTGKSFLAKPHEVGGHWHLVDATDKVLGRLAARLATILMGKHKPTYTPHTLTGDFVVVINAEKVQMSGTKLDVKRYYRHSRFFGSLKSLTAREMLEKDPAFVVEDAVKGMLPKNKLSRQLLTKLKAYKGSTHPHAAQKPQALEIK